MTTIVTRQTGPYAKGSPLTNTELDTNFINLNNDKIGTAGGTITGNLDIQGQANVIQRLSVGSGAYQILPNLIAQFTGTSDLYSQVNQQNINANGTGDFVITASNGSDLVNYLDMGMAGNTFNNQTFNAWSFVNPNDAYVMLQGNAGQEFGGNLFIGTAGSGSTNPVGDIVFIQGPDAVEVGRFVLNEGLALTGSVSNVSYIDARTTDDRPAYQEGRFFYDNEEKALSYYNDAGVTLNIGQEDVTRVWNNTAITITDGTAVYINGDVSTDGVPGIDKAIANTASKCQEVYVTTTSITSGGYGYATKRGKVHDLNTSGYTKGTYLYLSDTVPGTFTDSIPITPNFAVYIGMVLKQGVSDGLIAVQPQINYPLNFATGSIFIAKDGLIDQDSANLHYDLVNHRLGIGINTPEKTLHVKGDTKFDGNMTISGNLIAANIQSVSTSELIVSGNTIVMSNGATSPIYNAELQVDRGTANTVFIRWDESIDEWTMNEDAGVTGHILHSEKTAKTWNDYAGWAAYEKLTHPIGADLANATNQLAKTANTAAFAAGTLAQSAYDLAGTKGIVNTVSGTSGRITTSGTTAITVDLATVPSVTAGTYSYPSMQVDAYGRITTISNQTPVTSISNTAPINVSGSTGAVTVSMAPSGVAAKTYGDVANVPTITVDQYGRVTAVTNTAIVTGATISDDTTTNSGYYPLFATTNSGTLTTVKVSSSKLNFNPSTGLLTATSFTGAGTGLTGTAAGLTANVSSYQSSTTATTGTYYPQLSLGTSGNYATYANGAFSFNAATGALSATSFTGAGTGLTGTAASLTANVANYESVTTATTGTYYPQLALGISGTYASYANTLLSFNAATGVLSANGFSGAATGLTGTATGLTANVATYDSVTTATTGTYYPVMVTAVTGTLLNYANNAISFNAATGTLTSANANVTSAIASTTTTNGALTVVGGVGVRDSVYVGNRVGFANTTQSFAYQVYNATLNSIDTIFG